MFVVRLVLMVLYLVAAANVSWAMGGRVPQEQGASDGLVGKPAPDVTLPKTDGTSGSVISAREGHKAVLFFWATWCPHCHEELAKINEHLPAIEAQGLKVILIDVGETKEEVMAYLEHQHITLPSFIDEENALQDPYQLIGVPTLVFIDNKGIVLESRHDFPLD